MKIYLKLNGTQVGPYKIEDVQGWIRGGYYKMEDPARFEDSDEWITVSDIPGVDVVKGGHTIDGHLIPLSMLMMEMSPIYLSVMLIKIVP